jgi:hypothetical protein
MRRPAQLFLIVALFGVLATGCDMGKIAVNSTAKVIARGQPAMKQESDYTMAARAIPGSLKTVEAFHMVNPENHLLTGILAEGYCQYATGFIEDEWEQALIAKDFDEAALQDRRASKAFFRCMGYGLHILGKKWQKAILGSAEDVEKRVKKTGWGSRDALMWVGVGLAGAINHNKTDPSMVAQLQKVRLIMNRVIALDDKHKQKDKAKRGLAHIVMGMLALSIPEALGGKPDEGKKEFERAIEITENKFLLAKVLLARRYAVAVQDREMFRKLLIEVLQTDPAIWPDQRLANEIAHRRAKRYLKQEKDWF